MSKKQGNIFLKLFLWFTVHPWLKLISLVLAVAIWFYVRGEISRFNF
ncbi:MAG: hypothetical protein AB1481_01040 [Candidatus Omnitrophota bacterium]